MWTKERMKMQTGGPRKRVERCSGCLFLLGGLLGGLRCLATLHDRNEMVSVIEQVRKMTILRGVQEACGRLRRLEWGGLV